MHRMSSPIMDPRVTRLPLEQLHPRLNVFVQQMEGVGVRGVDGGGPGAGEGRGSLAGFSEI